MIVRIRDLRDLCAVPLAGLQNHNVDEKISVEVPSIQKAARTCGAWKADAHLFKFGLITSAVHTYEVLYCTANECRPFKITFTVVA
ncbi:hypothetical protein MPTK1_4g04880 [Marchantia polymorpha subsp. ruderalis]|uniref:Uncharacterized protein n=2 Tax=Marchantia polymorpha TaxID=3197 RepID=A0AAF6B6G3_MARPO|nr:hypothetical protein MARPO_0150s0012 [Marchantia polymorpha]BBN07597.1 hypothetical protein Mp_4g04880 [Marchantia polymorpha subsp. ruderalis]|eukprot:PTQ28989.1 hypothetical protein MARPO_0150s0012 [Marchantia polymorpha]